MSPPLFGVLMLPFGINYGFVTVVLGYLLAQHGVSVGAIAGLVGLRLLPETWSFLCGPLVDATLSGPLWYFGAVIIIAAGLCFIAFIPLDVASLPLLATGCLGLGVASIISSSALSSILSLTTEISERGACAGWRQAGLLGGTGIGGGAGLWLATHGVGPRVAVLTLATGCASCVWPLFLVRVRRAARGPGPLAAARSALFALWSVIRSRPGALAAVAVTLPMGLGAALNLLPAVAAQDWHASSGLVASITGVLSGAASAVGCVLAGYLCDVFQRRTVFVAMCLATAVGEALMALYPHTAAAFAVLSLLNALLTGLAYGSLTAVIFERLGPIGGATVGGALNSLCNIPLVLATTLLGSVQTHRGSDAMLLSEAGVGVISVVAFVVLAFALRDRETTVDD